MAMAMAPRLYRLQMFQTLHMYNASSTTNVASSTIFTYPGLQSDLCNTDTKYVGGSTVNTWWVLIAKRWVSTHSTYFVDPFSS